VLAIALLQAWSLGWPAAVAAVARLAAMIMVADLVTATTPMLAMMDTIAPLLAPLRLVGLDARRLSLAFALVLRFVPVLLDDWRKREEAWRARTGRRASIRLLAPWAADLLRLADRVSEAIDARGFGGGSR
ncbi:MAG TPA: energy-coupling factor transporter transmembrane component T, partial [Beijerinckiaceae bacterium]